jgi:chitinase
MSYDFHGSWDGVTGHNSPLYSRKNEPEKDKNWNINSSIWIWIGFNLDYLN